MDRLDLLLVQPEHEREPVEVVEEPLVLCRLRAREGLDQVLAVDLLERLVGELPLEARRARVDVLELAVDLDGLLDQDLGRLGEVDEVEHLRDVRRDIRRDAHTEIFAEIHALRSARGAEVPRRDPAARLGRERSRVGIDAKRAAALLDERVIARVAARRRAPHLLLKLLDRRLAERAHLLLGHLGVHLLGRGLREPKPDAQLIELRPVLIGHDPGHAEDLRHSRAVRGAADDGVRGLDRLDVEGEEVAEGLELARLRATWNGDATANCGHASTRTTTTAAAPAPRS